jgi:hypothetical protein
MNEIRPIPNSPQERFCKSTVRELGFGGAAGPGKSYGLILDVLYQLPKEDYHAILFRRTYKQLMEAGGLIDYSQQIYPTLGGIFNQTTYTWKFPRYHGNTIRFSHIEREADIEQHAGSAYAYIGFDQLDMFTERQYLYLFSRSRSANPDINLYIRSTFNPGGIAHHWIKKRFIEPFKDCDRPKYFKRINGADTEATADDPLAISRFFISAKLEDNPYLWRDGDSEYERNLYQLDSVDFRRLRFGDWDIRRTGRVYHAFSEASLGPHSDELDYSQAEGYWHGHDFGAVNQVWGLFVRIKGIYYLMHEQQLPEGTTAARCDIIKAHFQGRNIVIGYGGSKSERQQRLDYRKEGVEVRLPDVNDVESQINTTNRMFENGTLKICSNMVHTIDQLENCVRDEKEGIADKSVWHRLDVLRYFCAGVGSGLHWAR